MRKFSEIAVDWFGGYFHRERYEALQAELREANIFIPVEKWLAMSMLASIISAIIFAVSALILSKFGFTFTTIYLLILISGIVSTFLITFYSFRLYPKLRSWELRRKIDAKLPYAIGYVASMSRIGIAPYQIFKKLSEQEDVYGEVSVKARHIVRDVELFGIDFVTALRNLASVSPSAGMRTFLQGAVTTTLSGGEMRTYFINRAREYMEKNRRILDDFIATLGIVSEVYVIGLVAAPLFVIVMFTAMLMLRGASPLVLYAIIYGLIPLGSILFLLLIDSLTPEVAR